MSANVVEFGEAVGISNEESERIAAAFDYFIKTGTLTESDIETINIAQLSIFAAHHTSIEGTSIEDRIKMFNVLFYNMRDSKRLIHHLKNIGFVDYLTGINNRRAFEERLEGIINNKRRSVDAEEWVLVTLDIDNFKNVNDTYGHPAGDEAIKAIANRLKESVRMGDCARIGGEEFAVIVPKQALERFLSDLSKPLIFSYEESVTNMTFTVSAGVSTLDVSQSVVQNLAWADLNLYVAKRAGRNRYCMNDATDEEGKRKIIEILNPQAKTLMMSEPGIEPNERSHLLGMHP